MKDAVGRTSRSGAGADFEAVTETVRVIPHGEPAIGQGGTIRLVIREPRSPLYMVDINRRARDSGWRWQHDR